MKTIFRGETLIYVNDTDSDIIFYKGLGKTSVEACITELVDLDPRTRRRLDSLQTARTHDFAIERQVTLTQMLIEENHRGKLLLSPKRFTGIDGRVTNRVSKQIVDSTELGQSLMHQLSEFGLYDFIKRISSPQNVSYLQRVVTRLLASLSMSVVGAKSISDVSSDVFKAWLKFHRHPEHARWRPELWKADRDFGYQCLRELTFAFSRFSGDESLLPLATQVRSDSLSIKSVKFTLKTPPGDLKAWHDLFDAWLEELDGRSNKYDQMYSFLIRWIDSLRGKAPVHDPRAFLLTDRPSTFKEFLLEQRAQGRTKKDRESNAYPNHLRSAKSFTKFIVELLDVRERIYPLASDREIKQADNEVLLSGVGITERGARPLPEPLYSLVREILEEGEAGWPGSIGLCNHEVYQDGQWKTMYCPVLPTLYLVFFYIPPRVGQAKRLDSGEGDTRRFNATTMSWEPNVGPHAGYWSRCGGPSERGYARTVSIAPPITGIFVNTNKTGKPHTIKWQCEPLHRLLYNLRVWQETYNPINGPTEPITYVDGVRMKDTKKVNTKLPAIFPLFRLPGISRSGVRGPVPSASQTNEFWQYLMAETERRWNELNPNNPKAIVKRLESGQPYGAIYNPHGLRAAGLQMRLEQGIPIEIVSSMLAGHATVTMTRRYFKKTPAQIHEAMQKASQTDEAIRIANEMNELKSLSLEEAAQRAVSLDPSALSAAVSMDERGKLLWDNVGIGICPWDGTRCHDGGPCLRKERSGGKDKSIYGPVPGGDRNCILCRHFITTPAWDEDLDWYFTVLSRRLTVTSARLREVDSEMDELRRCRMSAPPNEQVRLDREIRILEQEEESLHADSVLLVNALCNTKDYIDGCERVSSTLGDGDNPSSALVVHKNTSVMEFIETSDFEQAALISARGAIHPIVRDEEAEALRDRVIEQIIFHLGEQPILFESGTRKQKRRKYGALAGLLLERVPRPEIRALEAGALRIQDLGLEADFLSLLNAPMGPSIEFRDAQRPHRQASESLTFSKPVKYS